MQNKIITLIKFYMLKAQLCKTVLHRFVNMDIISVTTDKKLCICAKYHQSVCFEIYNVSRHLVFYVEFTYVC